MPEVRRYRLDDLRRFASSLATRLEVPPARASSLASHLLWFDEAGVHSHGLVRLPDLLERIEAKQVDPKGEGTIELERNGSAVFDARHGIPLLALERAGRIATEKARDAGIGFVTVRNLGEVGPASGIAAEMAIGPTSALIVGPDLSWTVALPSSEGLPAVFDPALATESLRKPHRAYLEALVFPWMSVFAPKDGWLVLAIAVTAVEPLSTFHGRVAEAIADLDEGSGRLLPTRWEARRREARVRGVAIAPEDWKPLKRWAERLGVETPVPFSPQG